MCHQDWRRVELKAFCILLEVITVVTMYSLIGLGFVPKFLSIFSMSFFGR
jgi:hypothetical protein